MSPFPGVCCFLSLFFFWFYHPFLSHIIAHFLLCRELLIAFRRSTCETPENPDFLGKDKMVISIKIRNISRSRMTKRTSPLESSRKI